MAGPGTAATGTWRDLLSGRHLGVVSVLAGGVCLYATNVYLTASLLPTAIGDIGGRRFYAWASTVFLIGSVISSTTVGRALGSRGPRGAYLIGLALFGIGTAVCAVSPTMAVMLAGRGLQGLGGGLLAGIGYAVINTALTRRLWTRASALVSTMWGVGTFVGPAAGGLFAQFGSWRGAFVTLAGCTAVIAALVPIALPRRTDAVTAPDAVPVGMLAGLPRSTFGPSPLRWIYLVVAVLAAVSTIEAFVPLFGQQLAGLAPVPAGFLGAALALGWTVGELSSASAAAPTTVRRILRGGPLVVASGLASTTILMSYDAGGARIASWAVALAVAGVGIGIAWPHLSVAAMTSVSPDEGPRAAAGVNTVQLIANAFGTALAGVLIDLGGSELRSAQRLLFVFAATALVGAALAWRATARTSGGSVTVRAAPATTCEIEN
ncbi:MAG: MFS transporter [Nocardiaceae bacterium]|nr:MFS transporter [Nocardiaceae bacterium]